MSEPVAPPRKRRRAALVCVECKRRKIKCDRNKPCGQCTKAGSVTCTFTSGVSSKAVNYQADASLGEASAFSYSASPESSGQSRSVGVSNASLISQFRQDGTPKRPAPFDDAGGWSSQNLSNAGPSSQEPTSQDLMDRVQKLELLLLDSSSRQGTDSERVSSPQITAPSVKGTLSKTRYFGQSHWMNSFEQFDKMCHFKQYSQHGRVKPLNQAADGSEIYSIVQKCKRMARVAKDVSTIQRPVDLNFKDYVPPREVTDLLVRMYFENFESPYRILHIPSFYRDYALYWENPQAASISFIVRLLLVIAIGTCFYVDEDKRASLRALAVKVVYAAHSWLGAPFEKGHLTVAGLQVQCLLFLARQTSSVGDELLWISAGTLLRTAINMGLHRDPKQFRKMSPFNAEMRRRLWATILEISIQSSLDQGMPPNVSFDDFDTDPPSNIDDESISETTKVPPVSNPMTIFTKTSTQIALLSSLHLRLKVVRMTNNCRYEPSYDEILRLGAEITHSCQETTALLSPSLTASQNQILDLFIRRFVLALHRPFAFRARTDPRFHFSRKVCVESSIITLSVAGDNNSGPAAEPHLQDGFTRLKLVAGGPFKGDIVHAAFSVCLELITQIEEEKSNRNFHATTMNKVSRSAREGLRQVIKDMIDMDAQRVALGNNNFKTHFFMSMALAQIDAMEEGRSVEEAMLAAAKQSTELCHELLMARMNGPVTDDEYQRLNDDGRYGQELGEGDEQDFGFELLTQEDGLDFRIPESWLFAGWDENVW